MSARDLRGPALAALLLLLAGMYSHTAEPPTPGSSTKCTDNACLRCAPDGSKCAECQSPFGLDSSGQCIPCSVTGEHSDRCMRCDDNRPDFCLECAPIITQKVGNLGFYATVEGKCAPCPDRNCANCTSLTGACTACNNYYGAVDGACLPCVDRRCRHCDGNLNWCTMCMNHVADPTTGQCLNCTDPYCVACEIDSAGSCSDCKRGFTLDGKGGCASCAKGCDHCSIAGGGKCDEGSCKPGWGHVASDATCVHCSANCTDCTSETQCRSCLDGLGVWKGACKSCGAGCQACRFDDKGQPLCHFCGEGGLDAATRACVPCQEAHCAGCVDDPTKCLGCDDGYRLTASNVCISCSARQIATLARKANQRVRCAPSAFI